MFCWFIYLFKILTLNEYLSNSSNPFSSRNKYVKVDSGYLVPLINDSLYGLTIILTMSANMTSITLATNKHIVYV